ncbi:MAG: hypothetical protein IJQ87_03840 [Clostridia bacterium]|nr:hypothetical protein [Clostridia bacterium]
MSEISKDENVLKSADAERAESRTDELFKKRVIAFTVGAVVLLAVLLILMCYQLIKIGVENSRKTEYITAIAELEAIKNDNSKTIEIMQKKWWIVQRARDLGYEYPDDIGD